MSPCNWGKKKERETKQVLRLCFRFCIFFMAGMFFIPTITSESLGEIHVE
jgi:hypothetical protein